jgi:hypothetical protein
VPGRVTTAFEFIQSQRWRQMLITRGSRTSRTPTSTSVRRTPGCTRRPGIRPWWSRWRSGCAPWVRAAAAVGAKPGAVVEPLVGAIRPRHHRRLPHLRLRSTRSRSARRSPATCTTTTSSCPSRTSIRSIRPGIWSGRSWGEVAFGACIGDARVAMLAWRCSRGDARVAMRVTRRVAQCAAPAMSAADARYARSGCIRLQLSSIVRPTSEQARGES